MYRCLLNYRCTAFPGLARTVKNYQHIRVPKGCLGLEETELRQTQATTTLHRKRKNRAVISTLDRDRDGKRRRQGERKGQRQRQRQGQRQTERDRERETKRDRERQGHRERLTELRQTQVTATFQAALDNSRSLQLQAALGTSMSS